MKAHLAKVSLALLSTVFLFGCQERGSEPVGPEGLGPEFAKVKNCDPTLRKSPPIVQPPRGGRPNSNRDAGGWYDRYVDGGESLLRQ